MTDRSMRYPSAPVHILDGIHDYVEHRRTHGDFIMAVLKNDLGYAVCKADIHSLTGLKDIVLYVYNEIPANCHGSPEAVRAWLANEDPLAEPSAKVPQCRVCHDTGTLEVPEYRGDEYVGQKYRDCPEGCPRPSKPTVITNEDQRAAIRRAEQKGFA